MFRVTEQIDHIQGVETERKLDLKRSCDVARIRALKNAKTLRFLVF
jgi:hypothetical protein